MKRLNLNPSKKLIRNIASFLMMAIILYSCGNDDDTSDSDDIAVTGVSVDHSSISLTTGSTDTLIVSIVPSDATNTSVSWSSGDESIATVSDGAVTAVAVGSTTITVATDEGDYTATCSVTVTDSSGSSGSYLQTSGDVSVSGETYSSTSTDENAVKVSGGKFTMTNCTVTKSGDTKNTDGSSFYGTNSAILSSDNGTIEMTGGTIVTDALGANGIVAYGGTVSVSDVAITCSQNLSRGIHATGGGEIIASNLTINTSGNNSSVIALDRGGGKVTVTGGTYNATGVDCAVLYSTGELTVENITGKSSQGEIGVIEGDNYITIKNSTITSGAGESSRGMMILQSGSGDAGSGINGIIEVIGGSLIMTGENTSLIEIVTNVTGKVTLDGVATTIPSGILMTVDYNTRWSTYGATGILILSGDGTTYNGSIVADSYSSAELTVNQGVTWSGAYDNANTAKSASITLSGGIWSLTDDSYVDTITLSDNATINKNGHSLTYSTLNNTSGTIND